MRPTPGRIVLYMLTAADALAIMDRRKMSEQFKSFGIEGNAVDKGDQFPMIITRAWGSEPHSAVNGQVILDGNDSLWVRSCTVASDGPEPGRYTWPVVKPQEVPATPPPPAQPSQAELDAKLAAEQKQGRDAGSKSGGTDGDGGSGSSEPAKS